MVTLFSCVVSAVMLAAWVEASAAESFNPSTAIQSSRSDLDLPAEFVQRLADRATIDNYQIHHHRVEAGQRPAPRKLFASPGRVDRYIKIVISQPDPEVARYRSELPTGFVPMPGFRAPILEMANDTWPALALRGELDSKQILAAEHIARRLAHDGLPSTLAQAIEILGTDRFSTNHGERLNILKSVGFPTDLLSFYSTTNVGAPNIINLILNRSAAGITPEAIRRQLEHVSFRFEPSHSSFRAAAESGDEEIGLLRVQVGGGYDDGIVPGGSIDVICQLARTFSSADFLISVPHEYRSSFFEVAAQTWRLRRTNQLTLISEPLPITPWSQDNGKPGWITAGSSGDSHNRRHATIVPRYASIGEGPSVFEKGESFLMDGLAQSGHTVMQSPLLFQGGNLLVVQDPKSNERILLVSETELLRNASLGLTRSEALEAFRVEFGVDRCVPVPNASYHLDFDVSLRTHNGELVAFVNDSMAAARIVVDLGINALTMAGALDTNAAQSARGHLNAGRTSELVKLLRTVIPRRSTEGTGHPSSLTRAFVASPVDSAAENVQCFLLGLDLIESSLSEPERREGIPDPEHAAYLQALRRMSTAQQTQVQVFKKEGWKVIPVPSTGDLYRGINYLNGIHHRHGYVMPSYGGFYTRLDNAAIAAFRQALGAEFKISPILTAESQRFHGGVHCTTSAYGRP